MAKVLVTGANGFIGTALCKDLLINGFDVVCAVRKPFLLDGAKVININDISGETNWSEALEGIDYVVHSAALGDSNKPYHEYDKVNVKGTINLAIQASEKKVKRFIFLSTLKVNGENSAIAKPFSEQNEPKPLGHYGRSKYKAEQCLLELAYACEMEVVIIRPPLVYGPKAKGNIESIFNMLMRGFVLPLGAIKNNRSLIFIKNLTDIIINCLTHESAANQLFLVSDRCDVSTTELFKLCAESLQVKAKLLPVPQHWLELVANLLGKQALSQRLCGSLQVDCRKVTQCLTWNPPYTLKEGLKITADYFNQRCTE